MSKYFPPKFEGKEFHCPLCGVYAEQRWAAGAYLSPLQAVTLEQLRICQCARCRKLSYWLNEKMLYPDSGTAAFPHDEMPDDVRADFEEARSIVTKSPRGAAALLRLAIQELMPHLGEKGKKIDDDIGSLVSKGLDPMIQQALDSLRVIGNESVHPGELDLRDTPDLAHSLFELVNIIVDERIAKPKRVAAVYANLPANKLKGIEDRDKSKP